MSQGRKKMRELASHPMLPLHSSPQGSRSPPRKARRRRWPRRVPASRDVKKGCRQDSFITALEGASAPTCRDLSVQKGTLERCEPAKITFLLRVPYLFLGGSAWPSKRKSTGSRHMAVGQNQWYHVGVGAPPILEPILVGIGMFTGGTGF